MRIALGAGRDRIVVLVARYAGGIVMVGTLVGLAIGYALMAYTYCHLRVLKDAEPKEAAADPTAWTGRR